MHYFDCNASGIKGYSVALNRSGISMIHTHHDTNATTIYRDTLSQNNSLVWMYMPIDDGEVLVQIYKATGSGRAAIMVRALLLLSGPSNHAQFVTNQGRCVRFGAFCSIPVASIVGMYRPPKAPSRIFFDISGETVRHFAFEDSQSQEHTFSPNLIPVGDPIEHFALEGQSQEQRSFFPGLRPVAKPPSSPNEEFFFSSCMMGGIVEITLCVDTSLPHRKISGMLLKSSKNTACLGQFRFDMLQETIRINSGFYIITQMNAHGLWYVADACLDPGQQYSKVNRIIHIESHGILEWWFTGRRCLIRYHG